MGFALNQTKPIKHGRETDDSGGYWKQCWLPSNGLCARSTHLSSPGIAARMPAAVLPERRLFPDREVFIPWAKMKFGIVYADFWTVTAGQR